jgi:hypothetical protein
MSTGSNTASIGNDGILTALKVGEGVVFCDDSLRTSVTVVALKDYKLARQAGHEYEIEPLYALPWHLSHEFRPNVLGSDDLNITCHVRSRCATSSIVRNASGLYCILKPVSKCPPKVKLYVRARGAKVLIVQELLVDYEQIDFGIPKSYRVEIGDQPLRVPLKLGPSEVIVKCAKGLTLTFLPDAAAEIKAIRAFTQGRITIVHKETSQSVTIHVSPARAPDGSIEHDRDNDAWFYPVLFIGFAAIFFFVYRVTLAN